MKSNVVEESNNEEAYGGRQAKKQFTENAQRTSQKAILRR